MSIEDELDQKIAHTQQQLEEIVNSVRQLLDVEKIFKDTSKELSGAASSFSILSDKVTETVGIMQGALQSLRAVTETIRSSDPGKITTVINELNEQMQKMRQELQLARDESGKVMSTIGQGVTANFQVIAALSEKFGTLHSETQDKIADKVNRLQEAIQGFTSKRFNVLLTTTLINLLIAIATLIKLFK